MNLMKDIVTWEIWEQYRIIAIYYITSFHDLAITVNMGTYIFFVPKILCAD